MSGTRSTSPNRDSIDGGEPDRDEASPHAPEPPRGLERARLVLDLWAKSVDAQLHFSRMATRTRQLGLALVASTLLVAVVLVGARNAWLLAIPFGGQTLVVHSSVLVLAVGVVMMLLLRTLDLHVHERMLLGALSFGDDLEQHHLRPLLASGVSKGMTQAIIHFSRFADARVQMDERRMVYVGATEDTVTDRVRRFYSYGVALPAATALVMLVGTNLSAARDRDAAAPVSARPVETTATELSAGADPAAPRPAIPRLEVAAPVPPASARGVGARPAVGARATGKPPTTATAPQGGDAPVADGKAADARPDPVEVSKSVESPAKPAEPPPKPAEVAKPAEAQARPVESQASAEPR